MRVCVFGAGAVGGNLAARIAVAGHDVSVVVRGAALEAIRSGGLRVIAGDEMIAARVAASDDARDLGPQDVVIVALKAHQLAAFAHVAAPLLGDRTAVVFAQNGIPWWYPGHDLAALLDPGHALATAMGTCRIMGGVIYSANAVVEPGIIRNTSPSRNRLTIAAPTGEPDRQVQEVAAMLDGAGIASPATEDLRPAIWTKLIGNASVSLLSCLTGRTSREVFDDPGLHAEGALIAQELGRVARADGVIADTHRAAPAPGHHSSILQDIRLGRPTEIAALVDAPQAIARAHGIPTPAFDQVADRMRAKIADHIPTRSQP